MTTSCCCTAPESDCCAGSAPPAPEVRPTTSTLGAAERWDHLLARWGYRRGEHRVTPGLYALGAPTADAPVFVTANYSLSFDALRSALSGIDAYILVLDTQGINVWCAAGKGTFGTEELVYRIEATGLRHVVAHRRLVLPQLGAAGIAAQEVERRTGFRVEYGPVRAADLPAYLAAGVASPEMRRVRFDLRDRLPLIPIELVRVMLPMLGAALLLYLAAGLLPAAGAVAAVLAGAVLFPVLLPWLPTRDFSTKGFILGGLVALPFAALVEAGEGATWLRVGTALALLAGLPPVTAFLALNFTGSTTFTSKSGVRREMATFVPVMAWSFGVGVVSFFVTTVARWLIG